VLGGVFICYRREDSAGFARLIYDRLTNKLGHDNVFFDVDNIPAGLDFVEVLSDRVGRCDALIAVIGRDWLSSADAENRRRLDDPHDTVRIEIEAALDRRIRVIPVLVDGASMPRLEELPDSLKKLARRQKIDILHASFNADVKNLTRALSLLDEELRAEAERAAREERKRRRAAKTRRQRRAPELNARGKSKPLRAQELKGEGARAEHARAVRRRSEATALSSEPKRSLAESRIALREPPRRRARVAKKAGAAEPAHEKPKRRTRKAEVAAARLEQARRRAGGARKAGAAETADSESRS
jgi:TIR domain